MIVEIAAVLALAGYAAHAWGTSRLVKTQREVIDAQRRKLEALDDLVDAQRQKLDWQDRLIGTYQRQVAEMAKHE